MNDPAVAERDPFSIARNIENTRLLPCIGDRVVLEGLQAASQYNGQEGTIQGYDHRQGRYRVQLAQRAQDNQDPLGVKMTNLIVVSRNSSKSDNQPNKSSFHVLIPCHVDSKRRLVTFARCVKSVRLQQFQNFAVMIGLSGSAAFREQTMSFLALVASQAKNAFWFLQDDQVDQRMQMEHVYQLFTRVSQPLNPQALMTFLDNDDMFHPMRLQFMDQMYQTFPFRGTSPMAIPCKLTLDPTLTPDECALEKLINIHDPMDFDFWTTSQEPNVSSKIHFVSNSQADELDASEYFDYVVPSAMLARFLRLTPEAVRCHRFCDVRLWKILDYMSPMEAADIPGVWLLAHFKVPLEEKHHTFDRHGQRSMGEDQLSFQSETVTDIDIHLSESFPLAKISPPQVAMSRMYVESVILQYIGWNEEEMIQQVQPGLLQEVTELRGPGFGEALWDACERQVRSLFDEETMEASRNAWEQPTTIPPQA